MESAKTISVTEASLFCQLQFPSWPMKAGDQPLTCSENIENLNIYHGNHQSSTCWWSCRKAVKWTTEVGLFPASKSFVNTRLPYLHITIIVERFWLFLNPGSYHRFYCLLEIYVRTLMNVSITSQTATQMRSAMFTHCHTAISSPWLLTTAASLKHRSILDYHCGKYVVFYCRAVFSLSSYLHRLCIEVFVFTYCQLYLSFFPP